MIDHIKKKYLSPESHLTEVLKKSSHSLLVNIGGLIGGLLLSIFLGQALGVEGFGIISLAVKIGSIILIFCLLGMKRIIVKEVAIGDRKSTRLNSSHVSISYAVFCLKKKKD